MADIGEKKEYELHQGLFGETDRNSGEYHFHSGKTQQLYSNARYSPVSEDLTPTRYYRPEASASQKRRRIAGLGFIAVLALCLCCAIVGGVIGAGLMSKYFDNRVEDVETTVRTMAVTGASFEEEAEEPGETVRDLSASEIYELACNQVVSVQTEFAYMTANGSVMPGTISGSGFIASEDGYIITNYHVIEKAYSGGYPVNITMKNGAFFDGDVAWTDEENDIAVIKIDAPGLVPVEFGDSDEIRGGEDIFIVGNPYGMLDFSMSAGRISNPSVSVATDEMSAPIDMLQLDVSVYEGNSGGPVYNTKGQVIGIVSAKVLVNNSDGIGFAIPIKNLEPMYVELRESGYIHGRADLGVLFFQDYNRTYSTFYHLPVGAFVDDIFPGSAADKAGLQRGDVISFIGQYPVEDYSGIENALKNFHAGEQAEVVFFREGNMMSTTVTFDEAEVQ